MHINRINTTLESFLSEKYPGCSLDVFSITVPPDKKMGDICLNIFGAVKQLKTSPQTLGASLAEYFTQQDCITDVQVLWGFVNLFLTDEIYIEETSKWKLPVWEKRNETVIVDYMGANIGKPLHIGHLCTPLFGQATINMLRLMGYTVIADMHQGDWGGIFGKLITGWKYFGDEKEFAEAPLKHLLDIYVKITEKIDQEETIDQECRDAFKLLSEGDETFVKLWQRFTDASLASVREVMSDFGARPDIWIGESFYEWLPLPKLGPWPDLQSDNTMSAVVQELIQSWIATKNEDESVGVVFPKESKLPSCILQKRDGTHGYLASDLAAIKYRLRNWKPLKMMYFVDNRQALHFKQLFATAEKAWIVPPFERGEEKRNENGGFWEGGGKECELTHAANGFVSLPEGAMSTRQGRVIFLSDVVEESLDRVKSILLERGKELADSDIRAVALGAIIYSFMAQDRERDWVFEWDKVLAFEGSSGPYVQYTYVRFQKMLQEFGFDTNTQIPSNTPPLTSYDKDLVLDILGFVDILAQCAETYKFHLLIAHITTTARHLNALYVNTPKLRDSAPEERGMRMKILSQVLQMIEYTCAIVSIPLPREM